MLALAVYQWCKTKRRPKYLSYLSIDGHMYNRNRNIKKRHSLVTEHCDGSAITIISYDKIGLEASKLGTSNWTMLKPNKSVLIISNGLAVESKKFYSPCCHRILKKNLSSDTRTSELFFFYAGLRDLHSGC